MKIGRLDSRDWRLFIILCLILNSPPLLVRLPIIGMFAFISSLFWISIPGIPFALAGLPFFEIREFGAIPNGAAGWVMVVAFWLGIAFLVMWVVKKRRARK